MRTLLNLLLFVLVPLALIAGFFLYVMRRNLPVILRIYHFLRQSRKTYRQTKAKAEKSPYIHDSRTKEEKDRKIFSDEQGEYTDFKEIDPE